LRRRLLHNYKGQPCRRLVSCLREREFSVEWHFDKKGVIIVCSEVIDVAENKQMMTNVAGAPR
jgi:hypothetical protein